MTAWSRKTWKFCELFLPFFAKTTPYGKIFKLLFRKLTWRHRLTLFCSNFLKLVWREIGEIVRYLPNKKIFGSLSNCRYSADRAQNLSGQPPTFGSHCSRFHQSRFIFGGFVSERVKVVFCLIEYFHDRLFELITRWLYCVECSQYSIWLEALGYLCGMYRTGEWLNWYQR